jgi:outer membrane protein OmpA-like peptidoglycan-associated protein
MQFRGTVLAISLLVTPVAALAQPFQGLYIGGGAGYNLPQDVFVKTKAPQNPRTKLWTQGGLVALGSVGYALGNGFRFELEGNFRQVGVNHVSGGTTQASASGSLNTYGAMANALFDMDIGVPWLYPYVGGGVGYAWTNMHSLTINSPPAPPFPAATSHEGGTKGGFAYQAIAGVSFPMPSVPGLSLTAEYRFMGTTGDKTFSSTNPFSPVPTTFTIHQQYNHSFLFGVRYAFNVTSPVAVAPAAAVPAPAAARSYLVFFDWDKAALTDRARQIVKEAADNSTRVQYTRIEVNGYADTSGTHQYNQGLSLRRARAVQAELVRDGVPPNAITIQGFGDTNLLVPTGPGVREPQNRRVEIVIR